MIINNPRFVKVGNGLTIETDLDSEANLSQIHDIIRRSLLNYGIIFDQLLIKESEKTKGGIKQWK